MLPTSLKAKVQRILLKGSFKKSESSKSRVKGLSNISAGFTFEKMFDDGYCLYYTCGNMTFRGMPNEKKDNQTEKIYHFLLDQGLQKNIELTEFGNKKVILLKVE
ncbi:hypothetical protein C7M22_03658 [Bacillus velezensis]|uniref:hypothetical protein n=1 Tax=Bacillus velezensis TaxID=492670 RepID=UPI000B928B51|nr:hypothetical protein [Bacillus velezensis]ASS60623.1 hypothetical protein CHN56_00078 [Bacillus velezensis]QHK65700.1 hypothetical protein C7M22_03658 [Bacillus velezensis]QHL98566.1 hypothetical protein C7M25_02792 [Bacillus velezensis]